MDNLFAHNFKRWLVVPRSQGNAGESKYTCITPEGERSPVLVYMPADYEGTQTKLKQANIQATMTGNRLRISPNIYNNQEDIDKLLNTLA